MQNDGSAVYHIGTILFIQDSGTIWSRILQ